jgi:hypothetical protein
MARTALRKSRKRHLQMFELNSSFTDTEIRIKVGAFDVVFNEAYSLVLHSPACNFE